MYSEDEKIVADLVLKYYEWLSKGDVETDPDVLFAQCRTPSMVARLREGIENINFIWCITAPLREAAKTDCTSEIVFDE